VIERRQTRYRLDDDRKIIARVTATTRQMARKGELSKAELQPTG